MGIAENIASIEAALKKAATAQGYAAPMLIAISKTQAPEKIIEALAAGHRVFGENRVQEASAHWEALKEQHKDIELHLVGPLQTNKVKEAVALFDVIQSVDREKLVQALADEMKKQNKKLKCFVQVNTGEEEQKAGVAPENLPALLKFCRECGLEITGLMCIPPVDEPPAMHFALLKKLAQENNLKDLSMGMSSDYEKAAALGATYVRVGTAVFGERGLN